MAASIADTTIISCEHCIYSVDCRIMKPCKDYAAGLNTNFNMFKEYEIDPKLALSDVT